MSQPQVPAVTFVPVAVLPGEDLRAESRERHGVKLVEGDNDGQGIHRLPSGLFGFTYSPGVDDTPLFTKRGLRSFEVHKTTGGAVIYIGFLTAADLDKLNAGDTGEIKLFPSLEGDFQHFVELPTARVLRFKPASTRDDGGLLCILRAE